LRRSDVIKASGGSENLKAIDPPGCFRFNTDVEQSVAQWNQTMTVRTFRDLLTKRPFEPFRIVMSSGEKYDVRHPEMAMLTRTDLLVGIDVKNDVPAHFKICSLLHVTAIEPLKSASAPRRS
jgi:hypothetical protein